MKKNMFYPSLYDEICEALASFGKLTADLAVSPKLGTVTGLGECVRKLADDLPLLAVWAISEDNAADIYDGRGSDIFEDLKPRRKYEVFERWHNDHIINVSKKDKGQKDVYTRWACRQLLDLEGYRDISTVLAELDSLYNIGNVSAHGANLSADELAKTRAKVFEYIDRLNELLKHEDFKELCVNGLEMSEKEFDAMLNWQRGALDSSQQEESYSRLVHFLNYDGYINIFILPKSITDESGLELRLTSLSRIFNAPRVSMIVDNDVNSEPETVMGDPNHERFMPVFRKNELTMAGNGKTAWFHAFGHYTNPESLTDDYSRRMENIKETLATLVGNNASSCVNFISLYGGEENAMMREALNSVFTKLDATRRSYRRIQLLNPGDRGVMYDPEKMRHHKWLADEMLVLPSGFLASRLRSDMNFELTCSSGIVGADWRMILDKPAFNLNALAQAGIEIVETSDTDAATDNQKEIGFYRGETITWNDLRDRKDARLAAYSALTDTVKEMLNRTGVRRLTIMANPGAGSTTMTRRLAYDLEKGEVDGARQCYVVLLNSGFDKSPASSIEKLRDLATAFGNASPLVIIADLKIISAQTVADLERELRAGARNIVLVVIETVVGELRRDMTDTVCLPEKLTRKSDLEEMGQRYRGRALTTEARTAVDRLTSQPGGSEIIAFPLTVETNTEMVADTFGGYVKTWIDQLPDNLRETCGYIALMSRFSRQTVNLLMLSDFYTVNPLDKEAYINLAKDKDKARRELKAFDTLITRVPDTSGNLTADVRPRYSALSRHIMDAAFGNMPMSDIVVKLIRKMSERHLSAQDTDYKTFQGLFIRDADISDSIDETTSTRQYARFTPMINHLHPAGVDKVFDALVTAFPGDPHFLAHYARFLYLSTSDTGRDIEITPDDKGFIKSKDLLGRAVELCDNNISTISHMFGTYYKKLLFVVYRNWDRSRQDGTLTKEKTDGWIRQSMAWAQAGIEHFDRAFALENTKVVGIMGKADLLRWLLKNIQRYGAHTDWTFIDNDFKLRDFYDSYMEAVEIITDMQVEGRLYARDEMTRRQIRDLLGFSAQINNSTEEILAAARSNYQSTSGTDKIYYATRLVNSLINRYMSASVGNNDPQVKMRVATDIIHRSKTDLKEAITALEYNMDHGDLPSFNKYFNLRMGSEYSVLPLTVDDAIKRLHQWLDVVGGMSDLDEISQVKPLFLLAIAHVLKALNSEGPDSVSLANAKEYFLKLNQLIGFKDNLNRRYTLIGKAPYTFNCLVKESDGSGTMKLDGKADRISMAFQRMQPNSARAVFQVIPSGVTVEGLARTDDDRLDETYAGHLFDAWISFAYKGPIAISLRTLDAKREEEVREEARQVAEKVAARPATAAAAPKKETAPATPPATTAPKIKVPQENRRKSEFSAGEIIVGAANMRENKVYFENIYKDEIYFHFDPKTDLRHAEDIVELEDDAEGYWEVSGRLVSRTGRDGRTFLGITDIHFTDDPD